MSEENTVDYTSVPSINQRITNLLRIPASGRSIEENEELQFLLTRLERKEVLVQTLTQARKEKYFKQYGEGLTYFYRMEAWRLLRNEFGITNLEKPTFDFNDHAIRKFPASQFFF